MNGYSDDESEQGSGFAIKLAVILVIGLIGGGTVLFMSGLPQEYLAELRKGPKKVHIAARPSDWKPRQSLGLAFEGPFGLSPGPDVSDNIPPEVQAVVVSLDFEVGQNASGTLEVSVSSTRYAPGTAVSLDGAANGAMNNAIAQSKDPGARFSSLATMVGGLEARRTLYAGLQSGKAFSVEGLLIQNGQQVTMMMTHYLALEAEPEASRILKSVRPAGQ